jgi:hypothetical protein
MTAGRDVATRRSGRSGGGHRGVVTQPPPAWQRPPTWSLTVTTPVAAHNLAAAVCSEHRSESPPLSRADVSEIHDHVWLGHHAPSAGLRKGQSGDTRADGFVRRGYRRPRTGHGGPIGTQITWSKATRPTLAPRDAAACSGWPTRCRAAPPDCVLLWPAWGQREHTERARFLLVLRAKGRRRVLDSWGVVTVSDRVGDPPQAATPRPLAGSALARAASTRGAPTDQTPGGAGRAATARLWGRFSPAGVVRP